MNLIVQLSDQRTGSTLLTNILYGLISPKKPVIFLESYLSSVFNKCDFFEDTIIVKTHDDSIESWERSFPGYDVYFVCSHRNDDQVQSDPFPEMDNLVTVSYSELLETPENPLDKTIEIVYNRVRQMIPNLKMNKNSARKRIIKMNRMVEELKDKPFSYVDPFFSVHGSHRNRGNDR